MKQISTDSPLNLRSTDQDDYISLLQLFRILWRGKFWIMLCVSLSVVLGGFYAYGVADPEFRATSYVEVATDDAGILDLKNIVSSLSTDDTSLNTEIATIQSRETFEQLIDHLSLTEDPEFNSALLDDPEAFSLREFVKNILGVDTERPELTIEQEKRIDIRNTAVALREVIKIQSQEDTYLFVITATSSSPTRAAELVNTLAEIYIENRRIKKFAATEEAIDWLSDQVRNLEKELGERQTAIQELQSEAELINLDALESLTLQSKDFRDRAAGRTVDLINERARLEMLESVVAKKDRAAILDAFDDPILMRLTAGVSNDVPLPTNDKSMFDRQIEMLLNLQRTKVDRVARETKALSDSFKNLEDRASRQAEDLQKLEQMQRELDVTRDLYQTFLTGMQEVTVQAGMVRADTSIMSRALPPLKPISPKPNLIITVAAVLGALLGGAALFVREAMISRVRSVEELEALTNQVVLGQIPRVPARNRKSVLKYIRESPSSLMVEAVRNLRTSLLIADIEKPPQVIMLTSSIQAEGKTTLSIALALNLAGLGRNVLLVEGDIRRCSFWEYFPASASETGIMDILNGKMTLSEAVHKDEQSSIDVLTAQNSNINAADVLSSKGFEQLIAEARKAYDYIIIDTPPVLAVPDARVFRHLADAALYVVRWDSTVRGQIVEGLRQFEMVGRPVTGLALTQIDPKAQKRYGYSSGYGAYGTKSYSYYTTK